MQPFGIMSVKFLDFSIQKEVQAAYQYITISAAIGRFCQSEKLSGFKLNGKHEFLLANFKNADIRIGKMLHISRPKSV